VINSLQELYQVKAETVVCDLHPNYISTRYAEEWTKHAVHIQHHLAHIVSCMAENELTGKILGVAWDGTGYGLDGTVWGGEFLVIDGAAMERMTSLRTFALPGGEKAVREPFRSAIGLLHEMMTPEEILGLELPSLEHLTLREKKLILRALDKKINAPLTSSVGRLFDAVASLVGVRQTTSFEGQAAIELENLALQGVSKEYYPFTYSEVIDWEPMITTIIAELNTGNTEASSIAIRFHNTLAEMIVSVARKSGLKRIVLSGGCFQSRLLSEKTITRLRQEGFTPYWHQRVPPNDGGIALGQIYAALLGFGKNK